MTLRGACALLLLGAVPCAESFLGREWHSRASPRASRAASARGRCAALAAKVGIFYGTEGGATGDVAGMIEEGLAGAGMIGEDQIFLIDDVEEPDELLKFDSILVGCPTWNTGADTERSGTPWDEFYYEDDKLPKISLAGKNVAVFGCLSSS